MQSLSIIKSTHKPSSWCLMGWILCFIILTSCGKTTPVVYSEFVDIGDNGIPANWEYTFSPAPFDSTERISGLFDVIMVVRYSNRCASKSVIFDVESLSLEHTTPDSTRLSIPLIGPDGDPIGKGNLGVFEVTDTLARGINVPDGYVVSVSSPLPPEETAGIINVGIKLTRSGQEEFDIYRDLPFEDIF